MVKFSNRALAFAGALMLSLGPAGGVAVADEEQSLVDKARIAVDAFAAQPDMADMRRLLARTRGVFIVPQLIKAAFIFGGEGGGGVMMARDPNSGAWSPPAFYAMGAGSIGLQIGAEVSEVMLLIMTEKGLQAVLKNEFKAGVDATIAVGPIGKGVAAATTTALGADIYSFSRSQGLFGGLSLDGSVITARHSRNQSYYGKVLLPADILLANAASGRGSEQLRQSLKAAEAR